MIDAEKKGYVQVYTGEGKGKTTAAIGLAVRAAGADLRVFVGQFLKGRSTSETNALKSLATHIEIVQYGRENFVRTPGDADISAAMHGLDDIKKRIHSGRYDIVIMDEANEAVFRKLFSAACLLDIIDNKPDDLELIITGRHAVPAVIEKADLVTEMKEKKHYFSRGIQARRGIEY